MKKLHEFWLKIINEEKEANYSYGAVMLFLDMNQEWWEKIQNKIDEDDIYHGTENDKDKFGLENESHVTLLYGLLPSVTDKEVEDISKKINNPTIKLNKLSLFENPKYDVLKFEINHKELNRMNKLFKKLPFTNDYPDYKPHVTVGYLKSGTGKKYIGELDETDSNEFKGDKIVYSKPNSDYINYEI